MNRQPYAEYKAPGAGWVEKIPQHWREVPFFSVSEELKRKNIGLEEDNVLSLSFGRIIRKPVSENLGLVPESYETYQIVEPGEVVFRFTDLQNDKRSLRSAIVNERGVITSAYLAVKPKNINPEFFSWLMRAYDHCKVFYGMGGGLRQSLKFSDVKWLPIFVPSPLEQKIIVRKIHSETTRIDALIEKKTRFIELLKEKRQALITQTVTKGLDPDVPMKDSGVEWIGAVPEHWLVPQLGKVSVSRCDGPFGSGLKSDHYVDSGVQVVRLQNIGDATFKGGAAYIDHSHWIENLNRGHEVLPGDLLMAGLGDDNNALGRCCVAPSEIGEAMVKADCYRFRLDLTRVVPEFAAYSLSATAKIECGYLANGATRARLNLGLASSRKLALPPFAEQKEIVRWIQARENQIERLMSATEHSVDLLRERRSALITAAVTGQIDLREAA